MGFADSTLFMKIAMGLGLVGSLFDVIGLAAPYWLTGSVGSASGHKFLFQVCISISGVSNCGSLQGGGSYLTGAQALSVMGFLAGVGSTVLIILYILFLNKKIVRLLALVGAFVAAGFILIGVIIVGTKLNPGGVSNVGWAMIMAIIGALIFIGAGAVVAVDVVKSPPPAS